MLSIHGCQRRGLASTGLAHVLATNLCVWFRFLVKEVVEGIYVTSYGDADSEIMTGNETSADTGTADHDGCDMTLLQSSPLSHSLLPTTYCTQTYQQSSSAYMCCSEDSCMRGERQPAL